MKPTTRQIAAIQNISKGDIKKDRQQVSSFLNDAKNTYEEVVCEYDAYILELD